MMLKQLVMVDWATRPSYQPAVVTAVAGAATGGAPTSEAASAVASARRVNRAGISRRAPDSSDFT